MEVQMQVSKVHLASVLNLSGSKSETNRLLLLKALFPTLTLQNASSSDDSEVMQKALSSNDLLIDVHHAGTAMRFLTAYFSIQQNRQVLLTGSSRMKERPIGILVDALRELGAQIEYLENEGFPPLKISGRHLTKSKVTLKANVSSQYISALLLIAPKLENGIQLSLEGEITSVPYINMTLALLNEIGIHTSFSGNKITVESHPSTVTSSAVEMPNRPITIESDWSSASYFYSIIALSDSGTQIKLSSYKQHSLQGDSALSEIYKSFGVETTFTDDQEIILVKTAESLYHPMVRVSDDSETTPSKYQIELSLNTTPDIAQTIAVTCFGLGLSCHLTGLHTLKIKETDRLAALKIELEKLGAQVKITNDSLTLKASTIMNSNVAIETYNDHRMAMAFAPLALKVPITILEADVVSKSYPAFWEDLRKIGFRFSSDF